jgi:hypothetical protein
MGDRGNDGANVVEIFMKEVFRAGDVRGICEKIIPKLPHENDGLIFTMDAYPYFPGTC